MIFNISIDNLRNIDTKMNYFRDYTKDLGFFFILNRLYFIRFSSKLKIHLINNNDNTK